MTDDNVRSDTVLRSLMQAIARGEAAALPAYAGHPCQLVRWSGGRPVPDAYTQHRWCLAVVEQAIRSLEGETLLKLEFPGCGCQMWAWACDVRWD